MRANAGVGYSCELIDIGSQLFRAQCTVETDHEWIGVPDGVPECLTGLARQRATGCIGDRARDHDGQCHARRFKTALDRKDGGLGIQGVKDGLDQEEVDPAFDQRRCCNFISLDELVEIDIAVTRIVDVR